MPTFNIEKLRSLRSRRDGDRAVVDDLRTRIQEAKGALGRVRLALKIDRGHPFASKGADENENGNDPRKLSEIEALQAEIQYLQDQHHAAAARAQRLGTIINSCEAFLRERGIDLDTGSHTIDVPMTPDERYERLDATRQAFQPQHPTLRR